MRRFHIVCDIWVAANSPREAAEQVAEHVNITGDLEFQMDDIFAEVDPETDEVLQDVSADMP